MAIVVLNGCKVSNKMQNRERVMLKKTKRGADEWDADTGFLPEMISGEGS